MQQPSGYSVGVLDGNTDLKTAVSDALATLAGNGVISVIETKWLGEALDLSSTPLTAGGSSASADADDADGTDVPGDESGDVGTEGATAGEGDSSDPASEDDALEAGGNAVQPEDVALL